MLVFAGQIPVVKREGILCNLRCIYRGNCVCNCGCGSTCGSW